MFSSVPKHFEGLEGVAPDANEIPSTFLSEWHPTKLSCVEFRAANLLQAREMQNAPCDYEEQDEMTHVPASYFDAGHTNMKEISTWRAPSAAKDTLSDSSFLIERMMGKLDSAFPIGCMMDKLGPVIPQSPSSEEPSTCAESETSEVPRDIVFNK